MSATSQVAPVTDVETPTDETSRDVETRTDAATGSPVGGPASMMSTANANGPANASGPANADAYIAATVSSASPARLRLMLLERAIEVAQRLATTYEDPEVSGPNEDSLRLCELLAELLSGVTGSSDPGEQEVCQRVADLYVFLLQHLIQAEVTGDAREIAKLADILRVETETWREVCVAEGAKHTAAPKGLAGLNFTA